jgi:hypothetical protein
MPRPTNDPRDPESDRRDLDPRLTVALKALPRFRASELFTAEVLRRLDEPRPRIVVWRWATLGAALLALLVSVPLVRQAREQRDLDAARRKLAEIRNEHRSLARDVERLQTASPVIYLGGTEQIDVVVDLSRLAEGGGKSRPEL